MREREEGKSERREGIEGTMAEWLEHSIRPFLYRLNQYLWSVKPNQAAIVHPIRHAPIAIDTYYICALL